MTSVEVDIKKIKTASTASAKDLPSESRLLMNSAAMTRLISIVLAFAVVSACTDDDEPIPDPQVLQVGDLSGAPGGLESVERFPPIGSYCAMEFGGVLGPSFTKTGVEYTMDDGTTITSLTSTNSDVSNDRIDQIRDEIDGCARSTSAPHQVEAIDLGSRVAAYSADAYPDAQAPAGQVAIARVRHTYVIVAVTSDDPDTGDLSGLLDQARERAQAADVP